MFNTVEGRILLTAENDTRQAIGEVSDSLQELKRVAGDASSTTAEAMTGLGGSGHEARRAFDEAGMSATRFGAIIGLAAGAAQAAGEVIGRAIKSIPEFVMDSEREFEKHSILINTMSADIKNLGLGARVSLVGIQEEARKLSDSWGISEEAVLRSSQVMLRNLPASNAQMEQMTELAANMSSEWGGMDASSEVLVRAVHSAGRAINVLERSGVNLTRTDRLMLEQWDKFGMQGNVVSFLLSHLSERYRNVAAEANKNVYGTNALAGAWEHLHLAVGEGVNPLWQQGLKLVAGEIAAVSDGIDDFRKKGAISTLNEMILKLAQFSGITPFEEWARGLTDAGTQKAFTTFLAGARKFVNDTIAEAVRLNTFFEEHGLGLKGLDQTIKQIEYLLELDTKIDQFVAKWTGTKTQAEINAGPDATTDAERRGEAAAKRAAQGHARFEDFLTPLDRRRPWLDHPTRGYGAPHSELLTPEAEAARYDRKYSPLLDTREQRDYDRAIRGIRDQQSGARGGPGVVDRWQQEFMPLMDTREQRDYDRAIRGIRDRSEVPSGYAPQRHGYRDGDQGKVPSIGEGRSGIEELWHRLRSENVTDPRRGRLQYASLGMSDVEQAPSWYKPDQKEISSEKPAWYHPQEDNLGDAPKAVREFKDETSEATKELDNFTRLLRHFNLDRGWLDKGGGGAGGGGGGASGFEGGPRGPSSTWGGEPSWGAERGQPSSGQRGPQSRWTGTDAEELKLGGPAPGKDFASKANYYTHRYMKDLGLTREQAEGLIGGFGHESAGLQPNINEGGRRGPPRGIGGYSWAQWTGSRQRDFVNFARKHGLDVQSDEAAYQFSLHELHGPESKALANLRRAGNLQEATVAAETYERAGVKAMGSRYRYARAAHEAFTDEAPAAAQVAKIEAAGATGDRPSAVAAKEPSPSSVVAQQMAEQQESMQRTTQLGRGQVDLNVKLDRDLRAGKPNVAHAENFDISMGVDRTGASYLARPGSPEYSGVPRI